MTERFAERNNPHVRAVSNLRRGIEDVYGAMCFDCGFEKMVSWRILERLRCDTTPAACALRSMPDLIVYAPNTENAKAGIRQRTPFRIEVKVISKENRRKVLRLPAFQYVCNAIDARGKGLQTLYVIYDAEIESWRDMPAFLAGEMEDFLNKLVIPQRRYETGVLLPPIFGAMPGFQSSEKLEFVPHTGGSGEPYFRVRDDWRSADVSMVMPLGAWLNYFLR